MGGHVGPVVRFDGTEFRAKDEVHYQKLIALRSFLERLLKSPVRQEIARVVLFGSVARGDPEQDSDVDLLLLGTGHLETIREAIYDLQASLGGSHSMEVVIAPLSDQFVQGSYFVRKVLRQGKDVYRMAEKELIARARENLYWLAHEYVEGAKNSLANGYYRLAVDGAYNAVELAAKAFLLGEVEEMPTRHGAVVRLFSDRFLKTERLPSSLGRRLNAALERRNRARYVYEVDVSEAMAQATIALAEELLAHLRKYISDAGGKDEQEDRA